MGAEFHLSTDFIFVKAPKCFVLLQQGRIEPLLKAPLLLCHDLVYIPLCVKIFTLSAFSAFSALFRPLWTTFDSTSL